LFLVQDAIDLWFRTDLKITFFHKDFSVLKCLQYKIFIEKKSKNEKYVFKWNVCFIAIYISLKIYLMTQQRHTKKKETIQ